MTPSANGHSAIFTIYGLIHPLLPGEIMYGGRTIRDPKIRLLEHSEETNHILNDVFWEIGMTGWNNHARGMEMCIVKQFPFYGEIDSQEYKEWVKVCMIEEKKYIYFLANKSKSPVYNNIHNPSFYSSPHPSNLMFIRDKGKVKVLRKSNKHINDWINNLIDLNVRIWFRKLSHDVKKTVDPNHSIMRQWQAIFWKDMDNKAILPSLSRLCREWRKLSKKYIESDSCEKIETYRQNMKEAKEKYNKIKNLAA